ncbi:unnamed protein product [Ambrosiozyma monospora]|uniref:Unnamed protein product n=1 Tax=Ambrosiozyma monospora TaxID=43982 RepID=A0A9W6Z582_AMBMO|nr:unnamed protein product [Ambrosiozyma monospora]
MGRFVDGQYVGSAMAQSDPIEDYSFVLQHKGSQEENIEERPSYRFLHANFPKHDPWSLKTTGVTVNPENGERTRLYGTSGIDDMKFDLELLVWKSMKLYVCDLKLNFQHFEKDGVERTELCDEIKAQLEYLQSTSTNTELPQIIL